MFFGEVEQWAPVTSPVLLRGSGPCSGRGGDATGLQECPSLGGSILDLPQTCWAPVGGVGCVALAGRLLGQLLSRAVME